MLCCYHCLEFRPPLLTALQTFSSLFARFKHIWRRRSQLSKLSALPILCTAWRLAFLLNISYWKPTSDSAVFFAGKGYDLLAINTQRGRDHGLGGYNAYRSFFGLQRISSMDTRPDEIAPEAWQAFQLVYRDPDDIDLFAGGLSETPMPGTF